MIKSFYLTQTAQHTKADYAAAMKFRRRKYEEWGPPVMLASARTGDGLDKVIVRLCHLRSKHTSNNPNHACLQQVLQQINHFHTVMFENGVLQHKRVTQAKHWMRQAIRDQLWNLLEHHPEVKIRAAQYDADMEKGTVTPRKAARELLHIFLKN